MDVSVEILRCQCVSLLPPWQICANISLRTRSSKVTYPKLNVCHVLQQTLCQPTKFVLAQLVAQFGCNLSAKKIRYFLWGGSAFEFVALYFEMLVLKTEDHLASSLGPEQTVLHAYCHWILILKFQTELTVIKSLNSDLHNSILYLSENFTSKTYFNCNIWDSECANSTSMWMNNELCGASLYIYIYPPKCFMVSSSGG
jgi:hypothetical protein